jgi:hypothetical protein
VVGESDFSDGLPAFDVTPALAGAAALRAEASGRLADALATLVLDEMDEAAALAGADLVGAALADTTLAGTNLAAGALAGPVLAETLALDEAADLGKAAALVRAGAGAALDDLLVAAALPA